jgi:6-pyruvoyltetrahydropterin/6-carboxytetrahydropterin synthase
MPVAHLTRRYRFAAAHRLHNGALSADQNARLYGKCNNPYGHGHDYVLEVTVVGPVDPTTGMVFNLVVLDELVQREVMERFDHVHLNLDTESFRSRVPTTENLCVEIYNLLEAALCDTGGARGAQLERVRLEETPSNFFEYQGKPSTAPQPPQEATHGEV